jgi:hypothetical protein
MKRLAPLVGAALLCAGFAAAAQDANAPVEPVAPQSQPALPLSPFSATYEVFSDGRKLGNATMQLDRLEGGNWRIDLDMRGSGLMRLAGLKMRQTTVFSSDGSHYRPLRQVTTRQTLFSDRVRTGTYDWRAGVATWTGDVKKSRRDPIRLREGDLDALLIDLAVVRDAAPGATLHYRYVDGGRARDQTYVVAAEPVSVEIDGLGYSATKVERVDGNDRTEVWVASGVPTPVRILQVEDGEDSTDLRLVEYTGASQ